MRIYLDIDGVCNFWSKLYSLDNYPLAHYEPSLIENLNTLVCTTGAQVVVSSTWRKYFPHPKMQEVLQGWGFTGMVVGETGRFYGEVARDIGMKPRAYDRAQEILAAVRELPPDCSWIAIDDYQLSPVLPGAHFVHTDRELGLTQEKVAEAIKKLNDQKRISTRL